MVYNYVGNHRQYQVHLLTVTWTIVPLIRHRLKYAVFVPNYLNMALVDIPLHMIGRVVSYVICTVANIETRLLPIMKRDTIKVYISE